jgi:pilus assembly protein FimV
MLAATASAVGMGVINVGSSLGQPLKAEIELVAIGKAEKDSLVARLASPEAYKSAGLEYPYGNKFKFQVESRANGEQYIKASSAQPVNDPFVSLLVELTWSSGKLSREYTFLLDPPGYVPEQPAQAKVETVAPEVQIPAPAASVPAMPEPTLPTPVEQAVPVPVITPLERAAPAPVVTPLQQAAPAESAVKLEEQAVSAEAAAKPEGLAAMAEAAVKPEDKAAQEAAAGQDNNEWLEVHRGDTLYKIAEQNKLGDISLERLLVAMYRINADQFDGRNMNRIKTGKILRLPSEQDVMSVSMSDAVKEIHAQAADWNAYRQKLASAATVSNQSQTVQQVATGKISSSIADMAPVAKESAKEVLKLSKGEAPGDQIGGAGGKSVSGQDKKNAAQEDAIAKNKALKEEQDRAALLEKNLKDMQRLAQLKSEDRKSVV